MFSQIIMLALFLFIMHLIKIIIINLASMIMFSASMFLTIKPMNCSSRTHLLTSMCQIKSSLISSYSNLLVTTYGLIVICLWSLLNHLVTLLGFLCMPVFSLQNATFLKFYFQLISFKSDLMKWLIAGLFLCITVTWLVQVFRYDSHHIYVIFIRKLNTIFNHVFGMSYAVAESN